MSIARIMQMAAAGASGGIVPATGYDFDPGVRDGSNPTSYTGTLNIPASSKGAIFVVHNARATGTFAAPSLTVGGDSCTLIHSATPFNDNITRVYYLANPTTGSVSFTNVDTGSISVGVAVIGLAKNQSISVASTIFTPSFTSSLGLRTILNVTAEIGDLIYCIAPSSNFVDEANSTNTPNSLFSPVAQALTGNLFRNVIHSSSDFFTSSETYLVKYDVTDTYSYADSAVYLVMSAT